MMLNGELLIEEFSDTPYVYCNILTLNRKAYFIERHIERLTTSADELFHEKVTLSPQLIEEQIVALLEANHASRKNNVKIEMRIDAVGDITLYCHEATIYSGYVMRPLQPEPYLCPINMPQPHHPTSATQATLLLANAMAQARGYGIAIPTESDGGIVMEPSMPLFLIKQGKIISPEGYDSVERAIVERAAQAIGLKRVSMRITATLLQEADEVIIADWQCITTLSHHAEHIYMNIVADKIAKAVATILKHE